MGAFGFWSWSRIPHLPFAQRWRLDAHDLTSWLSSGVPQKQRSTALAAPEALYFDGWQLAHAVRKAECSVLPPPHLLALSTLGFLAEFGYLMSQATQELRLAKGAIGALDDFVQSSFAGRLGQGAGLLWMQHRGYDFSARFSHLCRTAQPPLSLYSAKGKLLPSPDMAFDGAPGTALLETKGSFIRPTDLHPSLTQALNKGMEQLADWGDKFNPVIPNSFASALRLREEGDSSPEGSMLLWADPPNTPGKHRIPEGLIVAANYAGWLNAMNMPRAAGCLMGDEDRAVERVRVAEIDGEQVAVAVLGRSRHDKWLVTGIRMSILRSLAEISRAGGNYPSGADHASQFARLKLQVSAPEFRDDLRSERDVNGSFFADGTYLGICRGPYEFEDLQF